MTTVPQSNDLGEVMVILQEFVVHIDDINSSNKNSENYSKYNKSYFILAWIALMSVHIY